MNGTLNFTIQKIDKKKHFSLEVDFESGGKYWFFPNDIPFNKNSKKLAIESSLKDEYLKNYLLDYHSENQDLGNNFKTCIWDKGFFCVETINKSKIIFDIEGKRVNGRFILLLPSWGKLTKKRLWICYEIPR